MPRARNRPAGNSRADSRHAPDRAWSWPALRRPDAFDLKLGAHYDGIGTRGYESFGLRGDLRIRF